MFQNEPLLDFTKPENRDWIKPAFAHMESRLPFRVQPIVNGVIKANKDEFNGYNPSQKSQVVAHVTEATLQDVEQAIMDCRQFMLIWARESVQTRAAIIQKLADLIVRDRHELIIRLAIEVGKNMREADADVCEATDFCRYYAQSATELFQQKITMPIDGETNHYLYQSRGICAVIAPWNFPLAILCGMAVGPLVCGSAVILKPAEQSSAIALKFYELMIEAGVPKGVVHFLPGHGEVVGKALVEHPQIHLIMFTGSRQVGLNIIAEAAKVKPGQRHIKKVVAELGGKNAVIVDDDADLDEAVLGCMHAAFGFAGQKCSALSRIILLNSVYEPFKKRFVEAVRSLTIGGVKDLAAKVGPVIDVESQDRLLTILASEATKIIAQVSVSAQQANEGCFVAPTVFAEKNPQSPLGQQEFFGPFVTLFMTQNLDEALQMANDTDYALTGGFFSRSPKNIERVRREFNVGNLYINRGTTGAMVARQPFGGFKLSGVGGKAGGPDYLLHFLEPRTITENTMRRGFAPEA